MKIAIQVFEPEYLIISNNDMVCLEQALKISEIKNIFVNNPTVGIVGVNIVGLDGGNNSPCRKVSLIDRWILPEVFFPISRKFKSHSADDLIDDAPDGIVYRVRGSFMTLRSEVFTKSGGFDEKIFLYGEEPILAERSAKVGYQVYHYGAIHMLHNHYMDNKTLTRNELAKIKQRFDSEMYYYSEYCSAPMWQIKIAQLLFPQYHWRYKMFNSLKTLLKRSNRKKEV
ncbi:hypothetical protein RZ526_04950 [Enterococcus lactis]|uniref:glycosyltransferase family 2 protein n=1 Tax=Enterococcus lactis TaxID=357441 RepID=UPI002943FCD0|nr:hypothetical protein [Enterococcus lactis]MDV5136724.1 hypothetical protein [Enterococcus lactis]